jgi:glutaredoxin-related protein
MDVSAMISTQSHGLTMHATIYHNPQCGTSRNTLAILRHAGNEPTVIEYLKTPPDRACAGRHRLRHHARNSRVHSQVL